MIKAETLSAEGLEEVLSERDESLYFSSCLLRRLDRLLSRGPILLLKSFITFISTFFLLMLSNVPTPPPKKILLETITNFLCIKK